MSGANGRAKGAAVGLAMTVHAVHVEANGTKGHTAHDEWRNCQHPNCISFREMVSSDEPMKFRVTSDGGK